MWTRHTCYISEWRCQSEELCGHPQNGNVDSEEMVAVLLGQVHVSWDVWGTGGLLIGSPLALPDSGPFQESRVYFVSLPKKSKAVEIRHLRTCSDPLQGERRCSANSLGGENAFCWAKI
ncbi:Protein-Glutamine Gamma-Glutamyltransferase E [Manis pentadactyla]|nr:Protein-Glutamine Gamma-Glutamyltransferase E [Manis pentadactyla]